MTAVYVDPEEILAMFFRNRLVDPRARAEATSSQSFTATASQTDFVVTNNPSGSVQCITSVTVAGTAKTLWYDYYFSSQDHKVVFFSGQTLNDAVVVNYKYGSSNWVYDDKAREDLSSSSFPRISVMTVAGAGTRVGQYSAPIESVLRVQVDIWVREDYVPTIGGKEYEGDKLAKYLGIKVVEVLTDYESDLHPVMYGFENIGLPRSLPKDPKYQAYHRVVEFDVRQIDLGVLNGA